MTYPVWCRATTQDMHFHFLCPWRKHCPIPADTVSNGVCRSRCIGVGLRADPNDIVKPMDQNYEIELKFLVQDLENLESRLLALGGKPRKHPGLERNLLFDDRNRGIARRNGILRLRQDANAATLTFKLPAPGLSQEQRKAAKIRREFQVSVGNFEAMRAILECLGYSVWSGYEKIRKEFELGQVVISLDTMPFGQFVELEGPLEEIQSLARSLDLDLEKRITRGYISLFIEAKRRLGLDDDYLGFDNWDSRALDWSLLGIEPADK